MNFLDRPSDPFSPVEEEEDFGGRGGLTLGGFDGWARDRPPGYTILVGVAGERSGPEFPEVELTTELRREGPPEFSLPEDGDSGYLLWGFWGAYTCRPSSEENAAFVGDDGEGRLGSESFRAAFLALSLSLAFFDALGRATDREPGKTNLLVGKVVFTDFPDEADPESEEDIEPGGPTERASAGGLGSLPEFNKTGDG